MIIGLDVEAHPVAQVAVKLLRVLSKQDQDGVKARKVRRSFIIVPEMADVYLIAAESRGFRLASSRPSTYCQIFRYFIPYGWTACHGDAMVQEWQCH